MKRPDGYYLLRLSFLILMIFGSILHVMGCDRKSSQQKEIMVVFRYDDYSTGSSTEMEWKIIEAFREKNASLTFAVIPYVFSGDVESPSPGDVKALSQIKCNILRNAFRTGVVDIALHGYSHQTIQANIRTEFAGQGFLRQVEKIYKGKKFLEEMTGVPVTCFVPPWNRYDLNTLRALEKLQFSSISANLSGDAIRTSSLKYLPATCNLLNLRNAVESARSCPELVSVIVVLFHQYEFLEIDKKRGIITYYEFCNLLSWLRSQRDVRMTSIRQATTLINDLSGDRFLVNKRIFSLIDLLPKSILRRGENIYYASNKFLKVLWLRVGFFYLTIVAASVLISFLGSYLVFPRSMLIMNIAKYASLTVSAIIITYAFRNMHVSYKGMVVSSLVFGGCIGIWGSFRFLKKQRLCVRTNNLGKKNDN